MRVLDSARDMPPHAPHRDRDRRRCPTDFGRFLYILASHTRAIGCIELRRLFAACAIGEYSVTPIASSRDMCLISNPKLRDTHLRMKAEWG